MKTMHCVVVVAVAGGLCLLPRLVTCDCKKSGPCSCESPSGTLDLSPLDGHGKPTFQDQVKNPGDYWTYSWNPCSPFTEATCQNVAGCQVSNDQKSAFSTGTQDSATFSSDPSTNNIILQYSAVDGQDTRYLLVLLMCDPNVDANLTVEGEITSKHYEMTLQSKHCCPQKAGGGLSGGSIFLIIFFSVALVYIAGGVVFLIFIKKASGREAIPNYSFWSALPGLIKDGSLFTFRRICSLCGRSPAYNEI